MPADQRVVGALKGNKDILPRQKHRKGGKLNAALRIQLLLRGKHAQLPKARRFCNTGKEFAVLRGGVARQKGCGGIRQAHRIGVRIATDIRLQAQVGKHRKNKGVHGAKRCVSKGQIAAPIQIIKQIAHGTLLSKNRWKFYHYHSIFQGGSQG